MNIQMYVIHTCTHKIPYKPTNKICRTHKYRLKHTHNTIMHNYYILRVVNLDDGQGIKQVEKSSGNKNVFHKDNGQVSPIVLLQKRKKKKKPLKSLCVVMVQIIVLVLRRLRQEDYELKASLSYTESCRLTCATQAHFRAKQNLKTCMFTTG